MELVSSDENLFPNLPSHLIIDILTRLPTKTISRCRCVCKAWLELLSSPEFANFRKLRPSTNLMIYKNTTSFNMVELEDEPAIHDYYFLPGTKVELPKGLRPNCMSMFGSVDGLLCFHEFGYHCLDTVYLWNPTTHESITIPSPGGVMEYPNITTHGFGLSSINGHYTVVRIYQEFEGEGDSRRLTKSECHVYTIGQGCWRNRGHAPFEYSCRTHGVFLNGNLHWWIQDPDGPEFISCFDLEKESFQPFPAPPGFDKYYNLATLQVYKDDHLSVCDNTSDFEITIWVMNEYGVKESWVKEFVIDKHPIDLVGQYYEVVDILKAFKDGEILLLWRDDVLISYNCKSNSLQVIDTYKFVCTPSESCYSENCHPCMQIVEYVPNFLSLKRFRMEIVENTFWHPSLDVFDMDPCRNKG